MFHECLGVVNAVPGEQGVCLGCLGVVFYCLGVFWGLLEGVSVLSEVSGSAFYSNLIYINCALIKSLTFSKRRGGPRCLKYQNVPTSRSFWPIGNPWERFQSWDIRVYFIPVPDDHTVMSKRRFDQLVILANTSSSTDRTHCSRFWRRQKFLWRIGETRVILWCIARTRVATTPALESYGKYFLATVV